MTDKTDIAALTRPVRDRYDWSNAVWRDCDQCGKQHTGTVTAEDGSQICAHCADQLYWSAWQVLAERALDQLEAERQRADDLVLHVNTQANMREKAEAEIAALKGDQVPLGFIHHLDVAELKAGGDAEIKPHKTADWQIPVFTAQQKLTDLSYDVLFNAIGKAVSIQGSALSISVRAFKVAIEAAGGIVKDGE